MATHVWFARHGEVEEPYVGTFLGVTDAELSEVGKHQAEALARYLEEAPLDAVLTSPRRRSRATAAPFSRRVPLKVVEGLAEMDFGRFEGKTWSEIERDEAEAARAWQADLLGTPCPDGESTAAFVARVDAALAELLDEYRGRTILLVSHAGTNRAILAAALGRPYLEMFSFSQDYGCLNAAAWQGEAAQVALVNLVPGPMSEQHGDGGRRL